MTVRTDFDFCSDGMRDYAKENGFWDDSQNNKPFDFGEIFSESTIDDEDDDDYSRLS